VDIIEPQGTFVTLQECSGVPIGVVVESNGHDFDHQYKGNDVDRPWRRGSCPVHCAD